MNKILSAPPIEPKQLFLQNALALRASMRPPTLSHIHETAPGLA